MRVSRKIDYLRILFENIREEIHSPALKIGASVNRVGNMLVVRNEDRLAWIVRNGLVKLSFQPDSLSLRVIDALNIRGGNADEMIAVDNLVIIGLHVHQL